MGENTKMDKRLSTSLLKPRAIRSLETVSKIQDDRKGISHLALLESYMQLSHAELYMLLRKRWSSVVVKRLNYMQIRKSKF